MFKYWRRSGASIVTFKHISHLVLMFYVQINFFKSIIKDINKFLLIFINSLVDFIFRFYFTVKFEKDVSKVGDNITAVIITAVKVFDVSCTIKQY